MVSIALYAFGKKYHILILQGLRYHFVENYRKTGLPESSKKFSGL